jgi:hypothetical protein
MRAIGKKATADAAKWKEMMQRRLRRTAEAKVSKSTKKAKAGANKAHTKTKRQFCFVDRCFSSGHCPDRARDRDAIVTPHELDGSKDPELLELFEKLSAVTSEFDGGGWNASLNVGWTIKESLSHLPFFRCQPNVLIYLLIL